MAYINKHGFNDSLLDECVVKTMTNISGIGQAFFDNISQFLVSPLQVVDVLRID
jgi:hypothetical protein